MSKVEVLREIRDGMKDLIGFETMSREEKIERAAIGLLLTIQVLAPPGEAGLIASDIHSLCQVLLGESHTQAGGRGGTS